MSEMDDIYQALEQGRIAAEYLATWQNTADGHDRVRSRQWTINKGIKAFERLRGQLRDGRMHVEPPDDWKATECMCSWPNASPPCSWCTDPANNPDESEVGADGETTQGDTQ